MVHSYLWRSMWCLDQVMRSSIEVDIQLFVLYGILVCAPNFSRIAISSFMVVWDVFWMLMCVLSSIGSWFRCPQMNLSCWQSVMILVLSSSDEMMMILIIWVIVVVVVQFMLLVNISRSCCMHICSLYWLWCTLLNIFFVRWCSLCYATFLMVVACYRWLRHNCWRCCIFVVLIWV